MGKTLGTLFQITVPIVHTFLMMKIHSPDADPWSLVLDTDSDIVSILAVCTLLSTVYRPSDKKSLFLIGLYQQEQ